MLSSSPAHLQHFLARQIGNMAHFIGKGIGWCRQNGIDDETIAESRLAPDMLPLPFQIVFACDIASAAVARAARIPPVPPPAALRTAELVPHLRATFEALRKHRLDDAGDWARREVVLQVPTGGELRYTGRTYVEEFVLPNVLFHMSMGYAILRHLGAPLGKLDFHGVGG